MTPLKGAPIQKNITPKMSGILPKPMVFDFVIVLCPNVGLGSFFEEYDEDGIYIGGQTRMQAAVDLYNAKDVKVQKIIVVGGGLEQAGTANKWQKTKHMRDFLVQHGVPEDDILCVASEPDTRGNLRAVWLTCHHLLNGKTVGILTNQYHLARTTKIAIDAQFDWNVRFFPLPAEELINTQGTPPPSPQSRAVLERIKRENQGLKDWQNGTYIKQHDPVTSWRGELLTQGS